MPIAEGVLARIKANDRTLTELNLISQHPPLSDNDMYQLSSVLEGNTNLKLIILGDNAIKDDGAIILAAGIAKSHVETLDISTNRISDLGAIALLRTALTSLNLSGNEITDDCLKVLKGNHTLRSLFLYDCNLTDDSSNYFLTNSSLLEVVLSDSLSQATKKIINEHVQKNVMSAMRASVAKFSFFNADGGLDYFTDAQCLLTGRF